MWRFLCVTGPSNYPLKQREKKTHTHTHKKQNNTRMHQPLVWVANTFVCWNSEASGICWCGYSPAKLTCNPLQRGGVFPRAVSSKCFCGFHVNSIPRLYRCELYIDSLLEFMDCSHCLELDLVVNIKFLDSCWAIH